MRNRKALLFGTAVAGVVLFLGSAAFACTTYRGRLEVTAGAGTSKAWGKNSGMTHCDKGTPYQVQSNATLPTTGGTITVGVYPTQTGGANNCPESKLSASSNGTFGLLGRHYYVRYYNGAGFVADGTTWKWNVDCMEGASGSRLSAADTGGNEIWINSDGFSTAAGSTTTAGTRQYTIASGQTANGTSDRSAVCVGDTGAGNGNQAPIRIVTV